jgi:hypothetical protein
VVRFLSPHRVSDLTNLCSSDFSHPDFRDLETTEVVTTITHNLFNSAVVVGYYKDKIIVSPTPPLGDESPPPKFWIDI